MSPPSDRIWGESPGMSRGLLMVLGCSGIPRQKRQVRAVYVCKARFRMDYAVVLIAFMLVGILIRFNFAFSDTEEQLNCVRSVKLLYATIIF